MRGKIDVSDKTGTSTASRGQVLVMVALSLTVLLLIAGLVLDYGVWLVQERGMRNAADGGAQAGVSELVKKPITAGKQLNAATHAMQYLNEQLSLGLPAGQIGNAASHALLDADGFGSEDEVPGYAGSDHFIIRTPVTSDVSCTGASWGERALTVRVHHSAPRFLTKLLFSGDQPVNVCATASLEGNGYAVAVLMPPNGSPQGQNISMKLAGSDSLVRICGGDLAVNDVFNANGQAPNPNQQPAYVKFMKPNSATACSIDNDNKMLTTIENPSPPTWDVGSKQVRVEGATAAEPDDLYQAPVHLPNYIQIPTWGATYYAGLNDALQPIKHLRARDAGGGTSCVAPSGYDAVDPGKYDLIQTGTANGQIAMRFLCPGVYRFVPGGTNTQGVDLGQGTTLAGQWVTLVFETGPNHNNASDSSLNVPSSSNLLLNCENAAPHNCPGSEHLAWWRTGDPRHDVPITIWIKPDANCPAVPTSSCSPSQVFIVSSGAGLDVRGIIFGPTDIMKIAGNGVHHGAGEIWAWTIEYAGNSQLDQVYEGTDEGYPLIVE